MSLIEIALAVVVGYIVLLLLVEFVLWKAQPNMENVVTLFINRGNVQFSRKLYGFEYHDKLYVSSNHWFRQWYHDTLSNPYIDVEYAGEVKARTAISIDGRERAEVASRYKLGFLFRLVCGFAPRRFLRLDRRDGKDGP